MGCHHRHMLQNINCKTSEHLEKENEKKKKTKDDDDLDILKKGSTQHSS